MEFEKVDGFSNLEFAYVSDRSGGYISKNKYLFKQIELTELNQIGRAHV